MQRDIEGEESVRRAQEAWKKMTSKRQAYAVVARLIAECLRARLTPAPCGCGYEDSEEMTTHADQCPANPDHGPLQPGEAAVMLELEAIETAMRDASQVRP